MLAKCRNSNCIPFITIDSPYQFSDDRGDFVKFFEASDRAFFSKEVFYTFTRTGFVRGMHLQVGPAASSRYIFIKSGSVQSVFIDLRGSSPSYLHICEFKTMSPFQKRFFVPPGVAHGFQAISDCEIIYITDAEYSPEFDTGINPNSIGVDWELPVLGLSERDSNLPNLKTFLKI